ncbi:WD40 domain-containing protein [Archangium lipolyticum]|uniref:WD40 domain-containing protein n=1 Tax=Archangium lipolyticum TaxID=2970465 RepID=UPI00214A6228|nr:SIR2 family protein [Archangium lipolyticum]
MKESPPSPPASLDPAFTELREAYESGNLIIFAGAGISAAAGLPGWKRLVELLSERARARKADTAALQEIAELTAARQYIDALSALKDCLGASEFGTVIERHLDDKLTEEPEVTRAIAALAPRLRAVLTTNIDHLLERAFAGRWPTLPRATGDIAQRREFILKLHGTLLDRSSWVFTREDYDRAIFADPNLHGAFTALFHAVPLLFVGYGLTDDDFDLHLGRIRAFAGAQPPRHFALVPADSVTPHRRKRLESSGVRLLPYDNPDGRHTAVVDMLRQLALPPAARGPGVSGSTRPLTLTEALGIIEAEGFTASTELPRESIHARLTGGPLLILRLLRCMDVPGTTVWLGQRAEKGEELRVVLGTVLSLPSEGGFALSFHEDVLLSSSRALLIGLASKLSAYGGSVRVYGQKTPDSPLIHGVEILGLRETLVPLVRDPLRAHAQQCLTAWSEVDEHRFVATRARLRETGKVLPVPEAITQALDKHGRVLILGDFGTGKSTHLKRQAALMAKAFLEEPLQAPAPLLLPLVGMPLGLDALVTKHVPGLSGEAFRLAADLNLIVPLFDGLDEMQLAPHQLEGAIGTLLGAFSGGYARAVLTSRKTLFPDPARVMAEKPGGPSSWAVVELEDLDRSEVIEFVGRRTPSVEERARVMESIRSTHDLTSLSKRPVLLDLIVKSQERLSSREMSAAKLYELAAEDWLGSREERLVIHEYRLAFARSLARKLFDSGAASTTRNEVARIVLEEMRGERFASIDEAELEVRTAVFLAHDEQEGRFRFAHRSFLEYFLAADISARLDEGREDALALPRLTPEVVAFLAGMEGWERRKALLRLLLTTRYQPRVSENALLALYLAAREREGEGESLERALESELPAGIRLEGARLADVDLPWISLPGAVLSGAVLSGARLAWADLRGARLDRARADHVILDGAVLDDASLVEADLFRASMVDASIEHVKWGAANREGLIDLHVEPARSGARGGDVSPPRAVLHTRGGAVAHLAWSPDRRRLASGASDGTVRVWDARSGELLHRLEGHSDRVRTVAYAPDGSRLASGSNDGTVRVWDARSGELLHRLEGHSDLVRTVAYAPDGTSLASGSNDETVRVWDARSGELLHQLEGHEGRVWTVAYAPDSSRLASGSNDGTIRVWDARSGELLHQLEGHEGCVWAMAYAPDGSRLASGADDGTVRVWDARTGTLLHQLGERAGAVWTVAYAPDSSRLASGSNDGTIRVWDTHSGELLHWLEGPEVGVWKVAYAPDGSRLASGAEDGTVRVWDARNGELLHRLEGHSNWVITVAYAPDSSRLASGADDGRVRVWDAHSGELLHRLEGHEGHVWTVAYAPDGSRLASGVDDGSVRVWDARSGELLHRLEGHEGAVETVEYAPDGSRLVSGADDGTVRVWDARNGKLLHRLEGQKGRVLMVTYAPDGSRLASGADDGTVWVWDARNGKLLHRLEGPEGSVWTVAYAPDGSRLASGSNDGAVWVWDARSGELLHRLEGHRDGVWTVAYAPDGSRLASGAADGTIRVWDARTGKLRHQLGHQGGVWMVVYAPDGSRMASGAEGGTVRVWDARTGELLHQLEGHKGRVLTVAYAPDGSRLVSGADDGTVRVWDAHTGELLRRLEGHVGHVWTLAHAPDGSRLASGADDGTVRVWSTHPEIQNTVLASTREDWVALVDGTPFFVGEGNLSRLLHYVSGPRAMSAALWRPLFQRPELVREALAGKPVDMKALGLDSYEACDSALLTERKRQGLVRRRSLRGGFQPATSPPQPAPSFSLPLSSLTLGLLRGGQRPPLSLFLEGTGLSQGVELSAVLHLGSQRLPATRVALERKGDAAHTATVQLQFEVPGPGEGLLALTSHLQSGHEYTETLTVSFVPENPYIVGPPIDHPRDFYGREEDLSRILRDLEQGYVALIGDMRIGKSSLLNQLEHRLSGSCQVVSLQRHMSNLEALPTRLAGLIAPGERLEGEPYDVLDRAITSRLTELTRARGPGARFTLLIDEAQLLTRSDSVRHELRNLFQSRRRDGLRVLVAGPPHAMRELAHDPTGSPFLNIFLPYRLGPMTRAELVRLVRTPLGDEYTVTDEAVDRIAALSGGRPLIAQLLCRHALEACHASRRFRIDGADIEQAFGEKAFDDVIDIYGYPGRWEGLPEQVREVLRRLAGLPATEREALDAPTLRLLEAHGLADKAKKRLDVEPTFFLWIQEFLS